MKYCIIVLSFVFGAYVVSFVGSEIFRSALSFFCDPETMDFSGLISVGCVLSGFLLALVLSRFYLKRIGLSATSLFPKKNFVRIVAVAYILTWLAGVPAVQSSNTDWAIKRSSPVPADLHPQGIELHYPHIRTFSSFPIIPFVVMTHHRYQVGILWGWEGLDFHLWYVAGIKRIFRITMSVS